jgi:hypothetical protein
VPPSGHTTRWCGPLVHALTSPFRLYNLSDAKTLNRSAFSLIKFHSAAAIEDQFRGTEVSVPGWGIAPGAISIDSTAISIDFTAISIDVALSHDKEGVVLPRG